MATRFHFPSSGTAAVSPATQSYTHGSTTRRPLVLTTSTALATDLLAPDADTHTGVAGDTLFAQFVSDPLAAQTFTSGNGVTLCFQCLEANNSNNLNLQVWMGIVSNDGTSAVGTILSKTEEATECANTLTSRFLSAALSNTVSCSAGDRLVIEVSLEGTPTASGGTQGHNGSIRFGGDGSSGDLAENDAETGTTFNPWLEFANTVTFLSAPPDVPAYITRVVRRRLTQGQRKYPLM
jgi:hypothetical protein